MKKFNAIKNASMLGVVANLFLLIIKGTIGFMTNSQSMIADAFNSAGDIFSSLMTFIGNKIASKPRDEDHHLGHGKAEYIYSLLISITMFLMAINALSTSYFFTMSARSSSVPRTVTPLSVLLILRLSLSINPTIFVSYLSE